MAGCFNPFHWPHIAHLRHSKKSKSLEDLPSDDMTLLQAHKLPHKIGRLFRSKSEQGIKSEGKSSPSGSPRTDAQPRRRLLRVVRDDQSVGEEWENPHVVRRYSKHYWESQMSEAQALQQAECVPYTVNCEHTILKKTQSQSTDSENEGNTSPSIGKHACFKEQVQVIEFVDKEKITKHAHFMHEAALLGEVDEDRVIDSCQSKEGLRKEAHDEFTRAKNSLDEQSEDSEDTDYRLDSGMAVSNDVGVQSHSDASDTDEPKKKHKKKKLHLHMGSWFGSGSESKDSDSDERSSSDKSVRRVNKKLLSTHLQTEVDRPESEQ